MELLLIGVVLSVVVAIVAASRGRSGFGWFLLSLVISPVISGALVLVLPSRIGRVTPSTHVKCPDCAELVLKEARVCKHCGCRLVPASEQPKPAEVAQQIM